MKRVFLTLLFLLTAGYASISNHENYTAGEGHIHQIRDSGVWVLGMNFTRYIIDSNSSVLLNNTNYKFNYELNGSHVSLSDLELQNWQLTQGNFQTENGHWIFPFVFTRATYSGNMSDCMPFDVAYEYANTYDKVIQAATGGWWRLDRGRSFITPDCVYVSSEQYTAASKSSNAAFILQITDANMSTLIKSDDVETAAMWSYEPYYKTNVLFQSYVGGTMADFAGMAVVPGHFSDYNEWAIQYTSAKSISPYLMQVMSHEIGHTFSLEHSDHTPNSVIEQYGQFYSYPYSPPNGYSSRYDYMGSGYNWFNDQTWTFPYQVKHIVNDFEAAPHNWMHNLTTGANQKFRLFAADHAASKAFLGLRTSRFNSSDLINGISAENNVIYFRIPWGNDFVSGWPNDVTGYSIGMEYRSLGTGAGSSSLGPQISLLDDQSFNIENTLDAGADNVTTPYSSPFPFLNVPWSAPGADKGTFRIRVTKVHTSPKVEFEQLYSTDFHLEDCSYIEMEIDYAPNETLPYPEEQASVEKHMTTIQPIAAFQDGFEGDTFKTYSSDYAAAFFPQPDPTFARIISKKDGKTVFNGFLEEVGDYSLSSIYSGSFPTSPVKMGPNNNTWVTYSSDKIYSCPKGLSCSGGYWYTDVTINVSTLSSNLTGSFWFPNVGDMSKVFSTIPKNASVTAFMVDAYGNRDYCTVNVDERTTWCQLKQKSACVPFQYFLIDLKTDALYYWSEETACNYEAFQKPVYDLTTNPVELRPLVTNEDTVFILGWSSPKLLTSLEWAYTIGPNLGYMNNYDPNESANNYDVIEFIGKVPENLIAYLVVSGFTYEVDLSAFGGLSDIALRLDDSIPLPNKYGTRSQLISRYSFNKEVSISYRRVLYNFDYDMGSWSAHGESLGSTNSGKTAQFYMGNAFINVYSPDGGSSYPKFEPFTYKNFNFTSVSSASITSLKQPIAVQTDEVFRSDVHLQACIPGSYNNNGICKPCPIGYMCPSGKLVPCPLGTYQNTTGNSACISGSAYPEKRFGLNVAQPRCPLGNYLLVDGECTPCPAKYTCDGSSIIPCLEEENKYYDPAVDACVDIPISYYLVEGSNTELTSADEPVCNSTQYLFKCCCKDIPPGYYMDNEKLTKCEAGYLCLRGVKTRCPVNLYSTPGSSQCAACPNGQRATYSQTSCEPCLAGSYCVNGTVNACSPGTYSVPGSVECYVCPLGTSSFVQGSSQCLPCKNGYSNELGATNCKPVPDGYLSNEDKTGVIACPSGFYCTGNQMHVCQNQYYTTGAAEYCLICPNNMYTNKKQVLYNGQNITVAVSCEACPEGYSCDGNDYSQCDSTQYSYTSGVCSNIPDGFFKKNNTIYPCPVGYHCPGGQLDTCTGWWYNDLVGLKTNCYYSSNSNQYILTMNGVNVAAGICPLGYWCSDRSFIECTAGTYQPVLGQAWPQDCKSCPTGTFSPFNAASECETIPTGFTAVNASIIKAVTGAEFASTNCNKSQISPDGFLECITCDNGYYAINNTCAICPAGSYCVDGEIKTCASGSVSIEGSSACFENLALCDDGYYSNDEKLCTPCPEGSFCLGSLVHSCPSGYTTNKNNTGCIKNHTPVKNGFLEISGVSVPCPASAACSNNTSKQCPAGLGNTTTGECAPCKIGTYSFEGGACTVCPQGYFNDVEGSSKCTPLSAGYYNVEGIATICPAGSYCLWGNITKCPENTYQPLNGQVTVGTCIACPAGEYSSAGSADCLSATKSPVSKKLVYSNTTVPVSSSNAFIDSFSVKPEENDTPVVSEDTFAVKHTKTEETVKVVHSSSGMGYGVLIGLGVGVVITGGAVAFRASRKKSRSSFA